MRRSAPSPALGSRQGAPRTDAQPFGHTFEDLLSSKSSGTSLTSAFSDSPTAVSRGCAGRAAPSAAGDDALLAIRDECRRLKQRDIEREKKLRQLAAQLQRTEEAAKRVLVARWPEARRGVAQQLLHAELELDSANAERVQLRRLLSSARAAASEHKRTAEELRRQLGARQAETRRLVVQVGQLQAAQVAGLGRRMHCSDNARPLGEEGQAAQVQHMQIALEAALANNVRLQQELLRARERASGR